MARDIFHTLVKEALEKESWIITHDPYPLHTRKQGGFSTDLGAEKVIIAERAEEHIAVEVKSFVHISILHDFLIAVGQYYVYNKILSKNDPKRVLFVALPAFVYHRIIKFEWAQEVVEDLGMKFILYDINLKTIVAWKK
jgi:XisH protein